MRVHKTAQAVSKALDLEHCKKESLPMANKIVLLKYDSNEQAKTHTDKNPYKCTWCAKSYNSPILLKDHMEKNHTGKLLFQCQLCWQYCASPNDVNKHMKTHPKKSSFACNICGNFFLTQWSLERHIKSHVSEKTYTCHLCEKILSSKSQLKYHIEHHGDSKSLKCDKSGILLSSESGSGATHDRYKCDLTEKKAVKFRCDLCGKLLATDISLKKHILNAHCTDKSHKCLLCSQVLQTKQTLANHMRTHLSPIKNLKTHKCDVCGMMLKTEYTIEKHLLKAHKMDKPSICELCGKCYITPDGLLQHMETHTREKSYSVNVKMDESIQDNSLFREIIDKM